MSTRKRKRAQELDEEASFQECKRQKKQLRELARFMNSFQQELGPFLEILKRRPSGKAALNTILGAFHEYKSHLDFWNTLPNELWSLIFSFAHPLRGRESPFSAIPYVCKTWYALYWDVVNRTEKLFCPNPNFFKFQIQITSPYRSILVDWLFEVVSYFHLREPTLHLAVRIIDRFLSVTPKVVELSRYQLIGVTAIKLACKSLQIPSNHIKDEDLIYITADTYSMKELHDMERDIVAVLQDKNFPAFPNCTVPPLSQFLFRFLQPYSNTNSQRLCFTARYYADLTLLDHTFMKYSTPQIAAAALLFSKKQNQQTWEQEDVLNTGFEEGSLKPCFEAISEQLKAQKESSLQGIAEKYHYLLKDPLNFEIAVSS